METAAEQIARALPHSCNWESAPAPAQLDALPAHPAVYLLVDAKSRPVQLATSQHFRRAVSNRMQDGPEGEPSRRARLADVVRGVRWSEVAAPFEARWRYYRICRALWPREYRHMISFGPAAFLCVDWQAAVPEMRFNDHVYRTDGAFLGPFPSRGDATRALEGLLDLFDLCRYPEQVRKTPRGQRCAYAEMGRCDAPCDGSAPLADYIGRSRTAWRFAAGETECWIDRTTIAMRDAAAAQRYEHASLLKRQIEFARHWTQHWSPAIRESERWTTAFSLPVARRKAWRLFLFDRGALIDGAIVPQARLVRAAREWLPAALTAAAQELNAVLTPEVRCEQAWLLAHFLHNRESETAIVIDLPERQLPAGLEESIAAGIAASLKKRKRARDPKSGVTIEQVTAPGDTNDDAALEVAEHSVSAPPAENNTNG